MIKIIHSNTTVSIDNLCVIKIELLHNICILGYYDGNNSPNRSSTIVSATYNRILRPLSLKHLFDNRWNISTKSGRIKMTHGSNGK